MVELTETNSLAIATKGYHTSAIKPQTPITGTAISSAVNASVSDTTLTATTVDSNVSATVSQASIDGAAAGTQLNTEVN